MALTEKYVSSAASGSGDGTAEGASAWTLSQAVAAATAGTRVNIKADGTYSRGASDHVIESFRNKLWRGYKTTIGDAFLGRNATGTLNTSNMPTVAYASTFSATSNAFTIFESINFTATVNGNLITTAADNLIMHCKAVNSGTGSSTIAYSLNTRATLMLSDGNIATETVTNSAPCICATSSRVIASRLSGGSAGILATGACTLYGNLIFRSGFGVQLFLSSAAPAVIGNTFVLCTSAFNAASPSASICWFDNLVTDSTGTALDSGSSNTAWFEAYSRYDRNSTLSNLAGNWVLAGNYQRNTTSITQANEFSIVGSDDYRLRNTSPRYQAPEALTRPVLKKGQPL